MSDMTKKAGLSVLCLAGLLVSGSARDARIPGASTAEVQRWERRARAVTIYRVLEDVRRHAVVSYHPGAESVAMTTGSR